MAIPTQEQARATIAELVERFRSTPAKARAEYNEQQTRIYFILPLFRALGWNTENPAEVTAEEQISRGFVDFGFYLDGVPRFYLETKKIPADLDDPRWAMQAINYAYLKGVTWAVLSDFEGIKVFNAEWEEANPHKAIFLDLRWERYADEDFEQLWLLSRPAIRAGEIDRMAEKFGRKSKKRPVTEQLFAQLTQWRRELFREIRGWDSTLWSNDPRAVDNAVQRLLDRLIFIRTVEDRGIEAPRLRPMARQYTRSRAKDRNLFHDLQGLFRELDEVYNARLFAESTIDHVEIYNPDLLRTIINGLYEVPGGFISYNFNAIDADVLGSIYEQYLGWKEYDREGKEAIELGKRQKRKSQGIYYTPQFVVRYIVQNTLGRLLEEGADPHALRILDPACGSGSFLIEAFDVLDRWLAQHGTPQDREFPQRRRLRILRENLYGVDLDEQAVEVARLNLLLRAAGKREKLPMLANIRRGNSLIDDPAVAGEAAFRWEAEFPEVFAAGGFDVVIGNPPYVRQEWLGQQKEYFRSNYVSYHGVADLYVYFMERGLRLLKEGGLYSIIVSNSFLRASYGNSLRRYLVEQNAILELVDFGGLPVFESAKDTYVCIPLIGKRTQPERIRLCRVHTLDERDLATYVSHNVYAVSSNPFTPQPWSLDDNADAKVFQKIQDQSIRLGDLITNGIFRGVTTGRNEAFVIDAKQRSRLIAEDPSNAEIIKPLITGRDIRRYQVVDSDQYLIFSRRGIDIERYPAIATYLKDFEEILRPKPQNWEGSWSGRKSGTYKWYEIQDSVEYYPVFESPKIIYPDIAKEPRFYLDLTGSYIANTGYCLASGDHFLLGILNSRLAWFAISKISIPFGTRAGQFRYRMIYQYMIQFPVRSIDHSNPTDVVHHNQIVSLVTQMLDLQRQHAEADAVFEDRRHDLARRIAQLDRQIDQLVYELYGLTDEEIAIVEGAGH